jgi:hypothetical protein
MGNGQTCAIGDLHRVLALVALLEAEAVKVGRQVICCSGVEVPFAIARVVGVGGIGVALTRLLGLEGVVEAVAAAESVVAVLAADLADDAATTTTTAVAATVVVVVVVASATTTAAKTTAATAIASSIVAAATATVTTMPTIAMASLSSVARRMDLAR